MEVNSMNPASGPVLTNVTIVVLDYVGTENPGVEWGKEPVNLVSFKLNGQTGTIVLEMPDDLEPTDTNVFTIFAGNGASCKSPPFILKED